MAQTIATTIRQAVAEDGVSVLSWYNDRRITVERRLSLIVDTDDVEATTNAINRAVDANKFRVRITSGPRRLPWGPGRQVSNIMTRVNVYIKQSVDL